MTIKEFIEARIAEKEAAARRAVAVEELYTSDEFDVTYEWARRVRHRETGGSGTMYAPGCPSPGRVLRECAAMRTMLGITPRALAAIWADHPDYRMEWTL